MKSENNNKSQIILGIIIFILIIICAIFTNNNKNNTNNLYSNINIDKSKLNIFYFNVGQADSSLIMYEGKTILIDAGNDSDGEEILNFINTQGIEQINYLIGTHIHEDHIGGMADIINNMPIGQIFMPANKYIEDEFYDEVLSSIENNKLGITSIKENDIFSLGKEIAFEVLHIDNNEPSERNNASIVIELTYGEQQYLFMGDSEKAVEDKLLNSKSLEDIDVLKVGHHGSNTSTTEQFVDKVLPEISIISVQEGRYEDVPNEDIIKRLESKNSLVYRTDIDGTIWLTSDGITNNITTIKKLNLNGANKVGLVRTYFNSMFFLIFIINNTIN